MTILIAAVALLWLIVAVLSVLVVLLYRQFGLVYIGSRGRVALTGLAPGSEAPPRPILDVAGRLVPWDWAAAGPGRGTLAVFAVPACRLCSKLTPTLNLFADRWAETVDFVFVERGPIAGPSHDPPNRTQWTYAIDPEGELHEAFDIEASPHAFVVSATGKVVAKGVVNTTENLEQVLALALDEQGRVVAEPLYEDAHVGSNGHGPDTTEPYSVVQEESHV